MEQIKISHLSHSYLTERKEKLLVLENITLAIEAGDFVVILGESGCGKTTLLNLLAGIIPPAHGAVYVNGREVLQPHHSRAVVFQQPLLLPWLTVEENIMFGCKLRGDLNNLENRAAELIKLMELSDFASAFPNSLSVGMAQRVSIARSLIGNPKILLLDEPFTALDYYHKSNLQSALVKLWSTSRFTTVFVTHDIEEALVLGRKIIILGNRPAAILKSIDLQGVEPKSIDNPQILKNKLQIQRLFKQLYNVE